MGKTHLKDGGPVGTLHHKGSRFQLTTRGIGEDPETGHSLYEFSTHVKRGQPVIQHVASGRYWTCSWRRLVALAEAEGLGDGPTAAVVRGA